MGDSERRRARDSERLRRIQEEGEPLWDALDQAQKEKSEAFQATKYNEHVWNVKRNDSERRYRERRKKEKGRE